MVDSLATPKVFGRRWLVDKMEVKLLFLLERELFLSESLVLRASADDFGDEKGVGHDDK